MAKGYDPNKDYSQAIKDAQASGASQSVIDQLQEERQNKIDAVYGGNEPNMWGSDKTFSETWGGGSGSASSGGSYGGSSDYYSPTSTPQKGPGYVTGGYDTGIFGSPILNDNPYRGTGLSNNKLTPDMSRRPDLAGKYATSNGFTVFYDENGYAKHASRGAADQRNRQDWYVSQGTYDGGNLWTDEEMLTQGDLLRIEEIRRKMQAGQLTGDQANDLANQIRSGYGYTIDKQGNLFDLGALSAINKRREEWGLPTMYNDAYMQNFLGLMNQNTRPGGGSSGIGVPGLGSGFQSVSGGFGYGEAPEYQSMYGPMIQAMMAQIQGNTFQNWAGGADYQALKDRYTASGQNAMQDVLGQVAARTGGYASSYATSAAGQAYNDYMTKLEDAARAMYTDEYNRQLQNLGLLTDMENTMYNQYLNELSQWNADRNFAYGAYRDQIADQQWNQQLQIDSQRYNDQLAFDRAETLAAYGDFSGYKALGYSDDQIKLMQAAYQSQLSSSRSSGGSSGSGSSGSTKPRLTASQTLSALESGLRNQQVLDAYEYWYGEPYRDEADAGDSGVKMNPNTLPSGQTILENSSVGAYGPKYGSVLSYVQWMSGNGKSKDEVESYLLDQLNAGAINEVGVATILQALDIERG